MLNSSNHMTMGGPSIGIIERGNIFSLQNCHVTIELGVQCKWQSFKKTLNLLGLRKSGASFA